MWATEGLYVPIYGPQKAYVYVWAHMYMGPRRLMYMSPRRLMYAPEGVRGPQEAYVCMYVYEPTYGPQKASVHICAHIWAQYICMYVHKALICQALKKLYVIRLE